MSFRRVVIAVPARPAHHCGHGDVVAGHRGGARTTATARRVLDG
ncbi:hypothetical protein [Streptomyces endophytica]|uniref:Uncharacterized protein n=1 Tax=Streptomyces endophytica TaxID=2991496 RepID=A0ABY6PA14_9ACTN|nr:hypothetical protein [Streptomyces endophytica]UZJ30087.1 hypothetical protein OJ254_06245 [Streptomyces endophytica]